MLKLMFFAVEVHGNLVDSNPRLVKLRGGRRHGADGLPPAAQRARADGRVQGREQGGGEAGLCDAGPAQVDLDLVISRAPKPEEQEKPMVEIKGCVGADGVP